MLDTNIDVKFMVSVKLNVRVRACISRVKDTRAGLVVSAVKIVASCEFAGTIAFKGFEYKSLAVFVGKERNVSAALEPRVWIRLISFRSAGVVIIDISVESRGLSIRQTVSDVSVHFETTYEPEGQVEHELQIVFAAVEHAVA